MTKPTLRRQLLAARASLTPAQATALSAGVVRGLEDFLAARSSRQVFSFVAHRGEPDLAALPSHVPATFGLPVIASERGGMAFHAWRPGEPLVKNRYGIFEPEAHAAGLTPDAATLILVPSVALDRHGARLGYGGGYYDRFLAKINGATVAGVAFERFVLHELPAEPHDLRVTWIATELGVRACDP